MTTILAIESSCDETAAAVVIDGKATANVVATQIEIHKRFGGVVPELASRHHLDAITEVVREALHQSGTKQADLDGVAVTQTPGLSGALLVGAQFARGLAATWGKPLIGIHHLEGHLFSPFIDGDTLELPNHVALVVSGGHTELVHVNGLGNYVILGSTRDDAVGEAYDKVAKMLGLGYPGGPVIDRLANEGNPIAIAFPRPMLKHKNLDFSFSGLKTAVLVHLERGGEPTTRSELADLCACFQASVIEILSTKALRALAETECDVLTIVGGVAANRGLRSELAKRTTDTPITVLASPLKYCGDNAAMIGGAACARFDAGAQFDIEVRSSCPLDANEMKILE